MATRRCTKCGTTWTSGGLTCAFCGEPGVEQLRGATSPILPVAALSTPRPDIPPPADLDRLFAEPPVKPEQAAEPESPPPADPAPSDLPVDTPAAEEARIEPEPAPAEEPLPPVPVEERVRMERPQPTDRKLPVDRPPTSPPAPERGQRRAVRTLAGLLLVALAFAGGNLVAAFAPRIATGFESATTGLRASIAGAATPGAIAGVAGAIVALLLLSMILLAGRTGLRGFLLPSIVLCAAAAALGLHPLGHRLSLERRSVALGTEVKTLQDGAVQWSQKAAALDERLRLQTAKAGDLQKRLDDLEKSGAEAAGEAARQSAAKDELLKAAANDRASLERTSKDQASTIADRDRRIAALEQAEKDLVAARGKESLELKRLIEKLEREVAQLKKENEEMKKEIEDLKKK